MARLLSKADVIEPPRRISPGEPGYVPPASAYGFSDQTLVCTAICDGWLCTRERDHGGIHAAHGSNDRVIAMWPASEFRPWGPEGDDEVDLTSL